MKVLRIIQRANGEPGPEDGCWVVSFDPDANGGRGDLHVTRDPGLARRFADAAEAMACWKQQSTVHPVRLSDGAPNRPLTAFTVEVRDPPLSTASGDVKANAGSPGVAPDVGNPSK